VNLHVGLHGSGVKLHSVPGFQWNVSRKFAGHGEELAHILWNTRQVGAIDGVAVSSTVWEVIRTGDNVDWACKLGSHGVSDGQTFSNGYCLFCAFGGFQDSFVEVWGVEEE